MNIVRSISELRGVLALLRGHTIGFVPTMGFLHEGHLSLVDEARANGADVVVVSIFVNPTQFGPNEDFDRYPRDERRDLALLESRAVDVVFLPRVEEMYPPGAASRVVVEGVAIPLEGERRPGHFNGVATVVLKLFNMVQPDLAVFGRKDAQQCAVIAQMVRDLDVPVQLIFSETVREPDGLAMSSRNNYLQGEERQVALALQRALLAGRDAAREEKSTAEVEAAMAQSLADTPSVELDYLRLVDSRTFLPPAEGRCGELLLVGAVRVGKTRLIDNISVAVKSMPEVTTSHR